MERKNGYIDLDKLFSENDTDINFLNFTSEYINFNFKINNQEYFFKYKKNISPYSELIAAELANDFGIKHVDYDLASYGDFKGVVSKNFRQKDNQYITGEKLLNSIYNTSNFNERNNLESIWNALEIYYKGNQYKDINIKNIMASLVSLSIFDTIICQDDRASCNWEIETDSTGLASLAPIFDNEQIAPTSGSNAKVSLLTEDTTINRGNLFTNLQLFLNISSSEYYYQIKDKLWIISNSNLDKVFTRIENKTSYPLPDDVRDYFKIEYRYHKSKIENILNTYETNQRKR